MHTQHLIIIAAGSALGMLLMAYFIHKAIRRAFVKGINCQYSNHQVREAALKADITRLLRKHHDAESSHQREVRLLKADHLAALLQHAPAPTFTKTDHQFLMQVHGTLLLAKQTWRALPGTEPIQVKAEQQAETVLELAGRIKDTLELAPVYEMPQNTVLSGAVA